MPVNVLVLYVFKDVVGVEFVIELVFKDHIDLGPSKVFIPDLDVVVPSLQRLLKVLTESVNQRIQKSTITPGGVHVVHSFIIQIIVFFVFFQILKGNFDERQSLLNFLE